MDAEKLIANGSWDSANGLGGNLGTGELICGILEGCGEGSDRSEAWGKSRMIQMTWDVRMLPTAEKIYVLFPKQGRIVWLFTG